MDHDFFTLFSRFWWLIFPLFWMVAMVASVWSRHARANRTLDIIKTYADQGKDPPPDLVKGLQGGMDGGWGCDRRSWRYTYEGRLHRTMMFAALAIVFAVLNFWHGGFDWDGHHHGGFLVLLLVFAALAFSNGLSLLFWRGSPPSDPNGPRR